jgi:hypothetical protein
LVPVPGTGTAALDGQSLSGFDEGRIALLLVLAKARMQNLEWGLLDSGPFAPVIGAAGSGTIRIAKGVIGLFEAFTSKAGEVLDG